MKQTFRLLALFVTLSLIAAPGRAGSMLIQCHGEQLPNEATREFAPEKSGETTTSTILYTPRVAETDTYDSDSTSFQCSFIVPPDYDSLAEEVPVLSFYGWVPPGQVAGLGACVLPNDVTWDIYWRRFQAGTSTGNAESLDTTTNTVNLSCETCGGGYCWEDQVFYAFKGDVLLGPGEWQAGDLVVLRVDRQDGQDDYVNDFFVWLPAVELAYPE